LEALKLGIHIINTAIPPLSEAASLPSIYTVARNARALGYTPVVKEEVLSDVSEHLRFIARRENLPQGVPAEYDEYHYMHQVPGGMISNFKFQLAKIGMEDRLGEVLEETARVRADLGYPIMVTPYSQFVGSQAAMNITLGERYKEVTDEIILYALGDWGQEEATSIDSGVKDRILGRARAKELAQWQPPEPSADEVRAKLGGAGVSDDEVLLRYFAGKDDVDKMKAAPCPKSYVIAKHPLVRLISELAKRSEIDHVLIERDDFSLRLDK